MGHEWGIVKMSGLPYFCHNGGCPSLFAQITSRWVYGVVLPDSELVAVTNIANCCVDNKDVEARCMVAFPVKGQMKLLYAAA